MIRSILPLFLLITISSSIRLFGEVGDPIGWLVLAVAASSDVAGGGEEKASWANNNGETGADGRVDGAGSQVEEKDTILEVDEEEELQTPLHMESHPLLQIPLALQTEDGSSRITPVHAFVDTGAQVSVLSYRAGQKAGLLHLLDRRYAGHALGVGHCRVLGRLAAGSLLLMSGNHQVSAPAITILEHTNPGVDLLLGLDFLREYSAILNLREEELVLSIEGEDVVIPFIRPRGGLVLNEEDNLVDDEHPCDPSSSRQCLDDSSDEEDDGKPIDMSGV